MNNKLDKSAVCTAFACAIAAFACGFAFCLALLSSAGSCYLLVKDFLFATRGYVWLQQLKTLSAHPAFQVAWIFVLVTVLLFSVGVLVRSGFRKIKCTPCPERNESGFVQEPVLPRAPSASAFVDENEVVSVLNSCRRHPDADGWSRLNALEPELLARYLKNEYPQVASVILLRLKPELSAAVLSLLPAGFAAETVSAMLNSRPLDAGLAGTIGKAVAENIENTKDNDISLQVGKILGHMDNRGQERIMSVLEKHDSSVLTGLKENNIVFEDLFLLLPSELEQVLSQVGEPKLVIALRGASENLRRHIYAALPVRQAKVIQEALSQLGPIRLRDIEKAQDEMVLACKNLFADILGSRKNG